MSQALSKNVSADPAAEIRLLGRIDFDRCLALQQRLVFEAGGRADPRIDLLLCEHPEIISVGRAGSRGHIRLSGEQLARRRIDVRWVARGGGCTVHTPGQLAVYPIVPLAGRGWTVGDYLRRLQRGLRGALDALRIRSRVHRGRFGIWGRTGQLVVVGVAVRNGIAHHGAFINVNPPKSVYGFVDSSPPEHAPPGEKTTMSSLLAECGRPARMTMVRATVVEHLTAAFGCENYHIYTGHPFLAPSLRSGRETNARAG